MFKALLLPEMKFFHLCSINITFYQLMASEEVIITDFMCAAKFTFQMKHHFFLLNVKTSTLETVISDN